MVSFTLNSQHLRYDGEAYQPLLWYLRDEKGLIGTKFGCGIARCGACQSGQIMTAAGLLQQTPKPTDDDIDLAMNGNICREG
ncbi:2Fe-2S iron-sulfur cluster-binding protein [Hyphomicrobium sp. CS1GBMeth3]|uniref:(2Fe-2S)-binding protein n=1 Tax=Hyphomicrobium sp. CS1GBMeth3 TaxID=1892845 RepID=UPI0009304AA5|nr:2Fe-2S iron-sulfur cluster-binding protein [Hyphomicrobium sp. CS1GBMeth3]